MDTEEQVNKSNKDVHVWRMNGDNNGESLILLMLFWGDTYISCSFETFWGEWDALYFLFFSLRWVSYTPNSTVRHLSIFTSRLIFSFLSRFRALAAFYFLVSSFFRALTSLNNVASGSNRNILSIYFTGENRNRRMFLAILSQIKSRLFLGGSWDGNGWIYVDAYFWSRSRCVSERASESWFNHMTSSLGSTQLDHSKCS